MALTDYPELHALMVSCFMDADPESDTETVQRHAESLPPERLGKITAQLQDLMKQGELPLEAIGMEANRWFGDEEEAREWLGQIQAALENASGPTSAPDGPAVKDSNGTALSEGDSVTVIKDLKVKGGSSDLKRGTLIKSIHLVDDPEVIECRVNGSTLVLKTCFLKRA